MVMKMIDSSILNKHITSTEAKKNSSMNSPASQCEGLMGEVST